MPGRFLLQFYFFFMLIKKMKFSEVVIGIFLQLNTLFVLPAPFPQFRSEYTALCKVCIHNGMHNKKQISMFMRKQVV